MSIRDRVKELRRVRAGDLQAHPNNWRTHGRHQRDVMRGVLSEVGYADALVARELPDGSLQLVDGHLRAEMTPNMTVPVLVVELNDAEAEKVLLTHDPVGGLAIADPVALDELLGRAEVDNRAVGDLLAKLAKERDDRAAEAGMGPIEVDIPRSYQVVVECVDETEQERVFEKLHSEGHKCRVLTL